MNRFTQISMVAQLVVCGCSPDCDQELERGARFQFTVVEDVVDGEEGDCTASLPRLVPGDVFVLEAGESFDPVEGEGPGRCDSRAAIPAPPGEWVNLTSDCEPYSAPLSFSCRLDEPECDTSVDFLVEMESASSTTGRFLVFSEHSNDECTERVSCLVPYVVEIRRVD